MTELGAVLEAAHTAISDLAAVLVAVRTGLGGDCVRAGSHLEMAEIDLLSARDALEKARLGGLRLLQQAEPDSGEMDVAFVAPRHLGHWATLALGVLLRRPRHEWKCCAAGGSASSATVRSPGSWTARSSTPAPPWT